MKRGRTKSLNGINLKAVAVGIGASLAAMILLSIVAAILTGSEKLMEDLGNAVALGINLLSGVTGSCVICVISNGKANRGCWTMVAVSGLLIPIAGLAVLGGNLITVLKMLGTYLLGAMVSLVLFGEKRSRGGRKRRNAYR